MKLVVGLGNPGRRYEGTRHNVGFDVLDRLAQTPGGGSRKSAFQGEVLDVDLAGVRTLLLWPHTFMNRSGASVVKARDFYQLENADLLIVCDDFHLPLGKLRFRAGGSSGGQKGLADIIRCLGTEQVPRLRIGVGEPPPQWDPAEFVLSKFGKTEQTEIAITVATAADAIVEWARDGLAPCMNRHNG